MKPTNQLFACLLFFMAIPAFAQHVPAQLPDPDGKLGDATLPVKVYILAGQSNMVGMGNLRGAKNLYNGVYFSSDPTAPGDLLSRRAVGGLSVRRYADRRANC